MQADSPKIRRLDPAQPVPADVVAEAVARLARGELMVVPTETVYGVAADLRVAGAEERLRHAKGRPEDKPIARLAADAGQVAAAAGAGFSPVARALAAAGWPGPLTLVLPVAPGAWTGYRIPDHPAALALLRAAGTALAVTSANRSGEPPATTAEAARAAWGPAVTLVWDAGPSPGGVPSTVVRVEGPTAEILRPGALGAERVAQVVQAAGGRMKAHGH